MRVERSQDYPAANVFQGLHYNDVISRLIHKEQSDMFTVWFSEGGKQLSKRDWPMVPRIGETITLRDSTGLFEVIRVHWQEHEDGNQGLAAHVSLRSAGS
jgi:hypothetical protein